MIKVKWNVNLFLKFVRVLYIIFALVKVFEAFYNQYNKTIAEDVLIRRTQPTLKKMRYPSITFCYKYKHGSKQVMDSYLPLFYEKSREKKCILDLIDRPGTIVKHYTGVKNVTMCIKHCEVNEDCSLWTYEDGMCYMKNEDSVLMKRNDKIKISGVKNDHGNDSIKFGYDYYWGDVVTETASTYNECQKRCDEITVCKRWTFDPTPNGSCYIKKNSNGTFLRARQLKTGDKHSKDKKCNVELDGLYDKFSNEIMNKSELFVQFRQIFLSDNGIMEDRDVLDYNEFWNISVPNENSGPCYTYNTPFDSNSQKIGVMRIEFNMTKWDPLLEIFLHDRNEMFYSKVRNLNTKLVPQKYLKKARNEQSVAFVKISTENHLPTRKAPCNDALDYNFFKCWENHYANKRGCQFPWNTYNDSLIKVCNKYSEMAPVLMNFLNIKTGAGRETIRKSEEPIELGKACPLPCFRKKFEVKIASWNDFTNNPTRSLKVVLDGFTIKHREEYLECDSTCIIGNIGGNIGFFLGASILLGLDVIFAKFKMLLLKLK